MTTVETVGGEWIRRDGDNVTLTITRCHACDARWFPPRDVCSHCASTDVHDEPTGDRGVVYASTVVRAGPAAYRPPYVLSYVDIDGVRVLAHGGTGEAFAPGTPVRLGIGEIGRTDAGPLMSYVITAEDGAR
ncbi:Zn-ribbon domain-containing OB-fold protein [Amycolatopsis thermophila]|uniref:OB-fold protein n=1 Tax=Amycolatopsis thermophila TaxID=206084 RepID=A0ABU0F1N9_9PSEU|nr:OB-fold domain-containing protein [Amycolatopsis thermophila]MDQ0381494.1 putative OB-fold protein [Amycolatopsis thermophila]